MSRIPLVDPDDPDVDPRARAILHGARAAIGRDFNVYLAVANHPEIFEGFTHLGTAAYFAGSLDPRTRELAYLTASVVNDCHY